ncbi:hypothetical protein SAMN02745121_06211 [Nannocystis exedens]|uniref:Uncharacterized protein n=1 Tax=Nannocystis exedens TaxID=54 RepID=A0A1I2ERS6_9BACT|nr:hypothetical protein NAEX_06958 [Nannocystis exedens]SFE95021.1 hypothetical protein SAMN02745121_06211 [Nannocystis exedens]
MIARGCPPGIGACKSIARLSADHEPVDSQERDGANTDEDDALLQWVPKLNHAPRRAPGPSLLDATANQGCVAQKSSLCSSR